MIILHLSFQYIQHCYELVFNPLSKCVRLSFTVKTTIFCRRSFKQRAKYRSSVVKWVLTPLGWSRQTCILTPLWRTAASPWRRRHADRKHGHALIRLRPRRRRRLFPAPSGLCGRCDTCPSNRTHRSRVDVFLLLAFLLRIQNLDNKREKVSVFSKCSRSVDSDWWATFNNASFSDHGWNM